MNRRLGISETDRAFFYKKMIDNNSVRVSLSLGWIRIEENIGRCGPFGIFGKDQLTVMSMTTEDARNLIAAIQELIPKEEMEKCAP